MIKKRNLIAFQRELFKLKDGGTISIDWVDELPNERSMRPIMAIVPGLTSDNDEVYVTNLLLKAKRMGFRGLVINYRGASNTPLSSHTLYCAGSVEDIRQPLEYIYQKYGKGASIFVVGNSMGANIVANYVGEEGPNCFLKAAVCVQAPMKMWECGTHVQDKHYGFYNYVLG